MTKFLTALLIWAALAVGPAHAQLAPAATFHAWAPLGTTTLAVTATTGNVALPSVAPVALICNTGTKAAYLAFGTTNAVVATTSGFLLSSGVCRAYSIKPFATQYTYLAAITAGSDTTSLDIETGLGSP